MANPLGISDEKAIFWALVSGYFHSHFDCGASMRIPYLHRRQYPTAL
jgi:hypothetical protein